MVSCPTFSSQQVIKEIKNPFENYSLLAKSALKLQIQICLGRMSAIVSLLFVGPRKVVSPPAKQAFT